MNPRDEREAEAGEGRIPAQPRVLQFGSFELRTDTGELRKHGIRVRLQTKPLQVLLALLEHPGEVVTREQLQGRLWPADTFVDFESGLNTAANRLRIALGDSADVPRYIETLPRIGYRFIAPVRDVPVTASFHVIAAPQAAAESPSPPAVDAVIQETPAEPAGAAAGTQPLPAASRRFGSHAVLLWATSAAAIVFAAMLLSGRFTSTVHGRQSAQFHEISFSHGNITSARFAPDGESVLYTIWGNGESQIYIGNTLSPESRSLGFHNSSLAAVSRAGELALIEKAPGTISDGPMLVRAPMNGGAPRETARSIYTADWAPDGETLAAIRAIGTQFAVEYPLGTVLFKTNGWASSLRVSPDGERIAFIEHPIMTDDAGQVRILDRSGRAQVTSKMWSSAEGLAWAPSGNEVWFTASPSGTQAALHGISLTGGVRMIANVPGALHLRDISATGRVLISRDDTRMLMTGKLAGSERLEDLSWYDFSHVDAISPDGNLLVFTEGGEAGGANYTIYVHNHQMHTTTRIARGRGLAISADQSRVLAMDVTKADTLRVVQLKAGEPKTISGNGLHYQWATFFPDGRNLLVGGSYPNQPLRMYTQPVDGGNLKPLNTTAYFEYAVMSPDGKRIAGVMVDRKVAALSLDSAQIRELSHSGDLMPVTWSEDSARVLALTLSGTPSNLVWVDTEGQRSAPAASFSLPELTGMVNLAGIVATPSGKYWAYSYRRVISQLYVVDGWS